LVQPQQTYAIGIFYDKKENTKGLAADEFDVVNFNFICAFNTNELGQFGVQGN
jgi:hypothetical protein